MAKRRECGHNEDWVLRLVDRGQRYVFCLGCLMEKTDMKTVDGRVPENIISLNKKITSQTEKANPLVDEDIQIMENQPTKKKKTKK